MTDRLTTQTEQSRDALAMALYGRFGRTHTSADWSELSSDDKQYWRRHASEVRGAVLWNERQRIKAAGLELDIIDKMDARSNNAGHRPEGVEVP